MKNDVEIYKYNESMIQVVCDDKGIIEDIYQYFKFKEPNFYPNKFSNYDGVVRMFNKRNKRLGIGLLSNLTKFLTSKRISFILDKSLSPNNIDPKEIIEYIKSLDIVDENGEKIKPYDYQYKAIYHSIKYKRATILAATSAGKSLIQYVLTRIYDDMKDDDEKILIVVPSILLVNQLAQNFIEYSANDEWDASSNIHKIAEGAYKFSNKGIYISTWQSLQDMPKEYFHQFGYLMVDECLKDDTLVTTNKGEKRIDQVEVDDLVLTVNEKTGEQEYKPVNHVHVGLSTDDVYEIELENGKKLVITGNHRVMTNSGWKRVDELSYDDKIINNHFL